MLISEAPYDAVSFTDGTSANFPASQRRSVIIDGTTPRSGDLNWYYILLQRYSHVPGELKSEVILKDFHTQPTAIQQAVWAGMKFVFIHITDVLPHLKSAISGIERRTYKGWYDHLQKREDKEGVKFFRHLDSLVQDYIAGCLRRQSSASRFIDLAPLLESPYSLRRYLPDSDLGWRRVRDVDFSSAVDPDKPRRTVLNIAKWSTRGDAIFATATRDIFENPSYGFFGMKERAFRAIAESYAFDHGDHPSVEWMDSARKTSIEALFPYEGHWRRQFMKQLHEVDSKKSYFTQISDIAAKFASTIYERHGLIEVAKKFEFVTFNGERITENVAAEKVRKWKQEGYI
jgi:hypothetical protein